MKLDLSRPETAWGVDVLARSVNCAVIYLNSMYQDARTQEALAEACEWLMQHTEDLYTLEVLQAKLDTHNKLKSQLLLTIKELDWKYGKLVETVSEVNL